MSSYGYDSWIKHFQGKGNIESELRKPSILYTKDRIKTDIVLESNEKITYIDNVYDTLSLIEFQGDQYRVSFSNIKKQLSVGKIDLKPRSFNIVDEEFTLSQYVETLIYSIDTKSDLSSELKSFLCSLTLYVAGKTNENPEIKFKQDFPVNSINNDFGEVLGPIQILSKDLLNLKKQKSRIYIPKKSNEPLMDYAILTDDKSFSISAKSSASYSTNTVKATNIIDLIDKKEDTKNKYRLSDEYKVLSNISSGTLLSGPVLAARDLSETYREFKGITEEAAKSVTKYSYSDDFSWFIKDNNLNNPSSNELVYEIEKKIVQLSRDKLNFTDIFVNAIRDSVTFMKFDIGTSGSPKFEIQTADHFSEKRMKLRNKNGKLKRTDKLGIQP